MAGEGASLLAEERIDRARQRVELRLDCRYLKQYHEVSVQVPLAAVAARDGAAIAAAFHAEHLRLYGYSLQSEGTAVEIINLRLQAIGATERPSYRSEAAGDADASAALKGKRSAYLPERDAFASVPVYDGHAMRCGHRICGPAIVEQQTTAIFVSEAYDCTVDALGSFVVYAKGREELVGQTTAQPEEALA
jgi:N-methylhydantoinase A